jgi:hypothetical protein
MVSQARKGATVFSSNDVKTVARSERLPGFIDFRVLGQEKSDNSKSVAKFMDIFKEPLFSCSLWPCLACRVQVLAIPATWKQGYLGTGLSQ